MIERIYDNFKMKINADFTQQEHDAKLMADAFRQANMAQGITKIVQGTMETLNLRVSNQATDMTNMASVNQTLVDTVKQQQKNIAELKKLITVKVAPSNNNNDATMKKLIRMMQGGDKKKHFFIFGRMDSTQIQTTQVVNVDSQIHTTSRKQQQKTIEGGVQKIT